MHPKTHNPKTLESSDQVQDKLACTSLYRRLPCAVVGPLCFLVWGGHGARAATGITPSLSSLSLSTALCVVAQHTPQWQAGSAPLTLRACMLISARTCPRLLSHTLNQCHCPAAAAAVINRPSAGTSSCSRVQRTTWCSGQPVLTWRQKASTWTGARGDFSTQPLQCMRLAHLQHPHVVHAPSTSAAPSFAEC